MVHLEPLGGMPEYLDIKLKNFKNVQRILSTGTGELKGSFVASLRTRVFVISNKRFQASSNHTQSH